MEKREIMEALKEDIKILNINKIDNLIVYIFTFKMEINKFKNFNEYMEKRENLKEELKEKSFNQSLVIIINKYFNYFDFDIFDKN